MNFLVINDSFPPLKSAAAGMIYNLTRELKKKHKVYVFTASVDNTEKNKYIFINNRFKKWRYQNHLKRVLFEIINAVILSYLIIINKKRIDKVDLVLWYSPSSFLWIPVLFSKLIFKCNVYLILRDIFPDWLYHIGLIKSKFLYKFLKTLVSPQYLISDIIGCQTISDKKYLLKRGIKNKIVILKNWQSISQKKITVKDRQKLTKLFIDNVKKFKIKKKSIIMTYLGSTSAAQDIEKIFIFFQNLNKKSQEKIQLNIFARDTKKVIKYFSTKNISINLNVYPQVPSDQISTILSFTDYGIVSLNEDHQTHNIPGKFVTYSQFSIPTICFTHHNQDLSSLIDKYKSGYVFSLADNIDKLIFKFEKILKHDKKTMKILKNGANNLFKENFDIKYTVNDIISQNEN